MTVLPRSCWLLPAGCESALCLEASGYSNEHVWVVTASNSGLRHAFIQRGPKKNKPMPTPNRSLHTRQYM